MRPPEEIRHDLVKQWLNKADEDFAVAEYLLFQQTPYLGSIGFHCQQAAEKFLKAFLVNHQVDFPKTHDIEELLNITSTVDEALAESLRDAITLNPYGVDIRYPGDFPAISLKEAKTALELAKKVRTALLSSLQKYLEEA